MNHAQCNAMYCTQKYLSIFVRINQIARLFDINSQKQKQMKTVKQIAAAMLIALSISNFAYAQDKMGKMESKKEMKEHVCTDACKNGKHVYAHGEKGHTCTKACKKMMKKDKM
jgi:hypothetical protein